jgi:hypothetical protein
MPAVGEVRPEYCRGCERVHGVGGYVLRGHGPSKRQLIGAASLGEQPAKQTVPCRIYFCPKCTHRTVVVPLEHSGVFRYAMTTIVMALAMWGLEQRSAGEVRYELSPIPPQGFAEHRLWPSLHRWVRERHRLWPNLIVHERATGRATAAAIASSLIAKLPRAPPSPTLADAWRAALLC